MRPRATVLALLLLTGSAVQASPNGTVPDPPVAPPAIARAPREASSGLEALELRLAGNAELQARTLAPLAAGLLAPDPARREAAASELTALARARGLRLTRRGGPWGDDDLQSLVSLLLVDPVRFLRDDVFRARVTSLLPRALAPETAPGLVAQTLDHLYADVGGFSFADSEAIEVAWGAAPRSSASREARFAAGELRFPDELDDPIAATIFSFPSSVFAPEDVRPLLAALRSLDPRRTLVALADSPMARSLAATARELDVHLVETYGRPYSPWPRDPFSTAVRGDGGLALVSRPYRQRGREADSDMARELVQSLPAKLDERWGEPVWEEAPIPFHNGHVLMAGGAAWISLHSLELQILRGLDLERVPVASFASAAGIDRYLAAARRAMAEMADLYGKPVHLVHPLPERGTAAERAALMRRIGGGAGFDLDSFLTFLPGEGGRLHALVGDVGAGRRLLQGLDASGWRALRETYGLAPAGTELASQLLAYQAGARAAGLQGFLDLIAEHLTSSGLVVGRLPLLLVPVDLLAGSRDLSYPDFVLGWNNVVVEVHDGKPAAEGFASLLPSGDRLARETYARAGTELELLPPLVASVVHNGGYRCASNQVRIPRRPQPAASPPPGNSDPGP